MLEAVSLGILEEKQLASELSLILNWKMEDSESLNEIIVLFEKYNFILFFRFTINNLQTNKTKQDPRKIWQLGWNW